MALIETIKDTFDDNSFNTSLWTRTNSTQIVEQNGQLELSSITAGNYVACDSVATYDLTASYALVELVDAGNYTETGMSSWEAYPLVLTKDASNSLTWLVGYSTLYAIKKVAGVTTNLATTTFSPTTHRWLRIREASGTVYFDYSSDGFTWTNFTSATVASLFAVTVLVLEISVGTWAVETITSTMKIDNVNLPRKRNLAILGVG